MAQLLRAQVAIAEELGSVPSTHMINSSRRAMNSS